MLHKKRKDLWRFSRSVVVMSNEDENYEINRIIAQLKNVYVKCKQHNSNEQTTIRVTQTSWNEKWTYAMPKCISKAPFDRKLFSAFNDLNAKDTQTQNKKRNKSKKKKVATLTISHVKPKMRKNRKPNIVVNLKWKLLFCLSFSFEFVIYGKQRMQENVIIKTVKWVNVTMKFSIVII